MKNTLRLTILLMACSLWCIGLKAQLNFSYTAGKFLIKGKVIDLKTETIIPLANIVIVNSNRGLTADAQGNFTMYVAKGDTLKFSSTGYISKVINVRNIDSSQYYTLEVTMMPDVLKIKDIVIYPFRDLDGFKDAFVNIKMTKLQIAGIDAPKYSNKIPKAKFTNPVSFLYDHLKRKSSANPDFRP